MVERAVFPLIPWLLLLLALITPVTLRLDVRYVRSLDLLAAIRVWGLGPDLRFRVEKTTQGHRLFRVDKRGGLRPVRSASASSTPPAHTILRALLRGDRARRLLLRGVSLRQLDIALTVSLGNAARTALTAGTVQSLWRALPARWRRMARLQVRPDFLNGQGGAQARCMVFFHLGTLLLTAVMLLMSYAAERMARPVHPAEEA